MTRRLAVVTAAVILAWATGTTLPAHAASGASYLAEGEVLRGGQSLVGLDGSHLIMRTSGDLVMTDASNEVVWRTGTSGHSGASVKNQGDGDIVVRSASGTALWSAGTAGHLHSVLLLRGALSVVGPNGVDLKELYLPPPPPGDQPTFCVEEFVPGCLMGVPPADAAGVRTMAVRGARARIGFGFPSRRKLSLDVHLDDALDDGACATLLIGITYSGYPAPPPLFYVTCDHDAVIGTKPPTVTAPAASDGTSYFQARLVLMKAGKTVGSHQDLTVDNPT